MASASRSPGAVSRIVVKVGTTLLTGPDGTFHTDLLGELARQVAASRRQGVEVVLVTSGAIGVGYPALGYAERPTSLPKLQAAAAVGQGLLMEAYRGSFGGHGIAVGQILLTRDGLHERTRYLNARNTVHALLRAGAVPIINENDSVSTDEIRFGDNDQLSALVAALVDADLLIVLTDVDGLYRLGPDGKPLAGAENRIAEVREIDAEIEAQAGAGSRLGTGGMVSKIAAARVVTASGAAMVIASGREPNVVERIVAGEAIGTRFHPRPDRMTQKKSWIAFGRRAAGSILVDPGARQALIVGKKSLLASGILSASGSFERGDAVSVACSGDGEFARGITNYSREQIEQIKGKRTDQIAPILGGLWYEEVIHRDNLVVL